MGKMADRNYSKPTQPFELWNIGKHETVYWLGKRGKMLREVDERRLSSGSLTISPQRAHRDFRYLSISRAALLPAPAAKITVAPPVTMSPPAQTPFREV